MPLGPSYRGFVYLIGSSRFGWYKIGKANSPNIRIKELGILLPFQVEVFAVWKSERPYDLERAFHQHYHGSHINGEWFAFYPDKVKEIVDTAPLLAAVRVFPSTDGVTLNPAKKFKEKIKDAAQIAKRQMRELRAQEVSRRLKLIEGPITDDMKRDVWKQVGMELYPAWYNSPRRQPKVSELLREPDNDRIQQLETGVAPQTDSSSAIGIGAIN